TVTVDYLPTASQQLRFAFLHYSYYQDSPFAGNFNRTPQIWHWPDEASGLYDRTNYGINFPYLFPADEKLIPTKIPTIEMTNFTTLDGGPYPSHSGGIVYTVADTVTKVWGRHTLAFGGLWEYSGENNFDQIDVSNSTPGATNNQNGQFIFTALHNSQPSSG